MTQSKVTRRQFLRAIGTGSSLWLLSGCRTESLLSSPTPTPFATPATIIATPTTRPTVVPTPTITPFPAPATLTPLRPISQPNGTTIYLPDLTTAYPIISTEAATPQMIAELAAPTRTRQPTRLPTSLPTATPSPTVTPWPTAAPTLTATPTPTPSQTPLPLPTSAGTATPTLAPTPTPEPCEQPGLPPPEVAPPFVGLHASADPHISWQERCLFAQLRPSAIKLLTHHPSPDVQKLALSQPSARWIVRAFLHFGGRAVTPEQFWEWTYSDVVRTLDALGWRESWVELHNEPNLVAEGLLGAWQDGAQFAQWWLQVLALYRQKMPQQRFLFPALSPGGDIADVRQSSETFLEQAREAVLQADGLGVHLYWSADYPLSSALAELDKLIGRFPNTPIWITEASYNRDGISDETRAQFYLQLIDGLRSRPTVQGVTFFVASALAPQFAPETWLGKQIAPIIGQRP